MAAEPGSIKAIYSTKAPCTGCVLKAIDHGVRELYFSTPSNEKRNEEIAREAGIKWEMVE